MTKTEKQWCCLWTVCSKFELGIFAMAVWVWLAALLCGSHAAVLPPPWADVRRNPCAAHPRGWLMLYWPSDGKCYTIYKVRKNTYEKVNARHTLTGKEPLRYYQLRF